MPESTVMPVGSARSGSNGRWVLLAYRLPREPSNPRVAVWRKLERLGVARLGDGLVALPADARTREQLDWLAEEIVEAGGVAMVWLATPGSAAQERTIAEGMRAARAAEYQAVIQQTRTAADGTAAERIRGARRLRGELRRIARRDFFPPAEREAARAAVATLAADAAAAETPTVVEAGP
jgi:DNA-binding transcriptional regulator PaaX